MNQEIKKPVKITFDEKRCVGCGNCQKVCAEGVYGWDAESKCPIVAHEEDCEACFLCEVNCMGNCLEVKTLTGPGQFFDAFYR